MAELDLYRTRDTQSHGAGDGDAREAFHRGICSSSNVTHRSYAARQEVTDGDLTEAEPQPEHHQTGIQTQKSSTTGTPAVLCVPAIERGQDL